VDTDRDVAALRLVDQFQRAFRQRNRADIVECLREMAAWRAPMGGQWQDLARIAADLGEFSLARQAIDLFVEAFDGHPGALAKKVDLLTYLGAFEEALTLLRTLPHDIPDAFSYALARGSLTISAGTPEEARQWLEEALHLRPQSGLAWHLLSVLADLADEAAWADRLVASERGMQAAPGPDRAYYYYALGRAHDARREHARAFAAVTRAGGETRALYPYDRQLDRKAALEAVKGYDASRIAAVAEQQSETTDRSIFVMGLPRSGTTLVQQILTSHSEVSGGAEVNLLRLLVHEAGDASYPAVAGQVAKAGAPSLARLWQHLLGERFPQPGRVVDKTTDTSRKLGLTAAVLPGAPLIWLKRGQLDCAWSCFRTPFMQGIRWSNDLRDIAFNFRLEDHLLSEWQRILGERLLVVPFEELVSAPEPWIRAILAHCDLAEQPQVFAPHENRGPVTTASVMQVRRPINRSGIRTAEPYRAYLKPFVDAYFS
jgi:hypothetical protein